MSRSPRCFLLLTTLASALAAQDGAPRAVEASSSGWVAPLQQWLQHRSELAHYDPWFLDYRNAAMHGIEDAEQQALSALDERMEQWAGPLYVPAETLDEQAEKQLAAHQATVRGMVLAARERGESLTRWLPYLMLLDRDAQGRDAAVAFLLIEAWAAPEAQCQEAIGNARDALGRWRKLLDEPLPEKKKSKTAPLQSTVASGYVREVKVLGPEALKEVVGITESLLRELADNNQPIEPRALTKRLLPRLENRYESAMQTGDFNTVRDCLGKMLLLTPEDQGPNVLLAMLDTRGRGAKGSGASVARYDEWRGNVDDAMGAASDQRLRRLGIESAGQTDLQGVMSGLRQGATFEFFRTDLPGAIQDKKGEISRYQGEHDSQKSLADRWRADAAECRRKAGHPVGIDPQKYIRDMNRRAGICDNNARDCEGKAAAALQDKARAERELPPLEAELARLDQLRRGFRLLRN